MRIITQPLLLLGVIAIIAGCDSKKHQGFLLPAPVISEVRPEAVYYGSTGKIRVNGRNFLSPAAVSFGNVSAPDVTVESSKTMVVTLPLLEPGTYDVTVLIPTFKSVTAPGALRVLFLESPDVTSVQPGDGLTTGGESVDVIGSGFFSGAEVFFGTNAAASVIVKNTTRITVTTPAHEAGVVDVTVRNIDGRQATLAGGFTFIELNIPPTAMLINPSDPSSRVVDLVMTLSDPDNSTADIYVDYSIDAGNTWLTAGEWTGGGPASSGRAALASGACASHTFRWDAFGDLGKLTTTVRLRVIPFDGLDNGAAAETADFTYIAPPILVGVTYDDDTGDGGVSEEDVLVLEFDEPVQLTGGTYGPIVLAGGTGISLPVINDSIGMNACLYDYTPGDTEVALYLGGNPVLKPDGVFDDAVLTMGSPSGFDITYELGDYITGLAVGNAMSLAPVDVAGKTTIAEHLGVLALPGLKISCNAAGTYRVTEADFTSSGIPTGFSSDYLRMFYCGKEVPIEVFDSGDGVWDAGDSLVFYSREYEDYYTDREVYFLVVETGVWGLRVGQVDRTPTGTASAQVDFPRTVRNEGNFNYIGNRPIWDGDPWVGFWLFGSWPDPTLDYDLDLPAVSSSGGNAVVRVGFAGGDRGSLNLPHHAQVFVNGNLYLDLTAPEDFVWFSGQMLWGDPGMWHAYQSGIAESEFPQSEIATGINVVTVRALNTVGWPADVFFINFTEITYNSSYVAYDNSLAFTCARSGDISVTDFVAGDIICWQVTDPDNPLAVTGGVLDGAGTYTFYHSGVNDYLAWSLAATPGPDKIETVIFQDLRDKNNQADYIIITHPDFAGAAATLKAHRESVAGGGYSVKLVNPEAVYNEFDFGRHGPWGIRNFLNYAYHNWQTPRPEFILLVGDATEDCKNGTSATEVSYIPAMKVITQWSAAPCDFPYADVTGTDYKPDYCVGRLPVQHIDNANTIVSKTINYELSANTDTWEKRLLHVSDNADGAGNFPLFNDLLITNYGLPNSPPFTSAHYWVGGNDGDWGTPDQDEANTAKLVNAMNNGALIVTYLGHGMMYAWAYEEIFRDIDVPALTNGDNSSVIIAFNCMNGYFTGADGFIVGIEGLSERFIEHPAGGAVATWSCTGLNYFPDQYVLADRFHYGYFVDGERVLGRITTRAISDLVDTGMWQSVYDIINTYLIFGDPALRIK